MTEDEAKRRWCPFGRKVSSPWSQGKDFPAVNRDQNDHAETMCLGSLCMSWRWEPLKVDAAYLEAVKKATAEAKEAGTPASLAAAKVNANRAAYGLPERSTEGYCGLAGKPEPA